SPDTHPADAVNANGWIGEVKDGAWVVNTDLPAEAQNHPIIWDAGGFPLWGDFPITITETHEWIFTDMMFLGFEPDVGRDDFFAIMAPLGDPGVYIRWRSGDATGMPQWYGLKSYLEGGTSGNNGWHVRTYGWEVYAVVDFYENTPPNVSIFGAYGTVLNDASRSIFSYVTDIDANDPLQAGADVVTMHYKVNDGDWTDVAATLVEGTDTDGKWEAVVPAGTLTPGDVLTFYFSATDKAGLSGQSFEGSYGFFQKENQLLVFYNDDGGSYPSWILTPYYDNRWRDAKGDKFPYDVWVGLNDGALSTTLVDQYDYIVQIDAFSPATMNDDVIGAWFASGTKYMFWSSQEWGYQFSGGPDDVTFPADDWHNQYMGIETIGTMDINYERTEQSTIPFPINPVEGDIISGPLYDFLGDSLQLYYYSDYELGFPDWADLMTAAPGAVVCFTDSAEGETMGVHKETNGTKTVFLTFDQLCLDTWALPSYTTTDGYHWTEPNVHSVVGAALNWFGLGTSVDDNNLPTIAAEYSLRQNYPNPFNPETVINYSISKPGLVKLAVYNVVGQKVAELVNEHQTAKSYKVTFDASNLTSGVYFYNLEVGDYSKTMKMMLLR
ncbi:MAG: T9SS type A sorting domain-containing protein, partial [bacterium]|nr:T9SS type A sorting domain-containing protein [bacterium]